MLNIHKHETKIIVADMKILHTRLTDLEKLVPTVTQVEAIEAIKLCLQKCIDILKEF